MRAPRAQRVRALFLALALSLVTATTPVAAHAESGFQKAMVSTFDVAVLRPLGFVTTLVGFGLFIPAAVITWPSGTDGIDQAWDIFVVVPSEHTFTRPLGEF